MMSDNKQKAKDGKEETTRPGISSAREQNESLPIIEVTQEVESSQKKNIENFRIQQNAFLANGGHQSLENVIKIAKERCEFLQRIADRSTLETADETYSNTLSQLQILLHVYKQGLVRVFLGQCYFHLLRAEYMELYYYATEVQSITTKLSDATLLQEAQRLLLKKFVLGNWDVSNKQDKALLCQTYANILQENIQFMEKLAGNELEMNEYLLLFGIFGEHITRCHFQFTLDLASRLLEIACKVQSREMIIDMLAQLGNLCLILGKYQLSYDIMQNMIHWEIDVLSTKAILFCNSSVVELLLELKNDSLEHAGKALELALQTENQGYIACGYGNIGLALEYMGMYDKAIEPYETCLQIGVDAGDYRVINNGLCNLGRAYQGLGDIERAKEYFKKAVNTPRPPKAYWCDTEEFRFSGDYLLAKLAVKRENWKEAKKLLMEVIKRCETLRKRIQDSPTKITFNDTQRKPFQYLQHVLLEEGKEMEALAVAEQGRGRDFFDKTEGEYSTQLNSVEVLLNMIKSQGIAVLFISALEEVGKLCLWFISSEGKLLKQHSIASVKCNEIFINLPGALYRTQGRHKIEFKGTMNKEYSIINEAIELVNHIDSTENNHNNSEKLQNKTDLEKVPSIDDNSKKPENNDENSEKFPKKYDNSENKQKWNKILSLVNETVRKTKEQETSCSKNESRKPSSALKTQGSSSERNYSLSDLIDQLSELILNPLQNELESLIKKQPTDKTARLLVIPQGTTFNIPFSALKLKETRLCERLTIIEAFSLHSFVHSTTESKENVKARDLGTALVVGNPTDDLPRAEEEAKRIAKFFGVTPLLGKQATKKAVMEKLSNARLIHFACHGESEGKALVLAQRNPTSITDCRLTAADVEGMKLDADLVVLSACHTARGEINSEGVVGLARAFQVAGARSVVTALWAIPDDATEHFMKSFYDNLRCGHPVADAIRATQVAMLKGQDFCELINWGSFKVFGANGKVM